MYAMRRESSVIAKVVSAVLVMAGMAPLAAISIVRESGRGT